MWFFVISVLSFCQLLRLQGDVDWGPLPVCPDLPGEVFGRVRRLWAGRLGGPRSQGTQGLPPQRSRPHKQGTIQRVSCVLSQLHGLLLTCRKLDQVFENQATFSKNWRKFCQLKTHLFIVQRTWGAKIKSLSCFKYTCTDIWASYGFQSGFCYIRKDF